MFRTNRMVFFCQILLISISTTAWGLAVSPNPPLLRIQSNVQKDSVIVDIENNTTNMTLLLSLTLPTGIGYSSNNSLSLLSDCLYLNFITLDTKQSQAKSNHAKMILRVDARLTPSNC